MHEMTDAGDVRTTSALQTENPLSSQGRGLGEGFPEPLPTTFERPREVDGQIHLTPAPGYVLSTCRNTAEGRSRAIAWGMHVCARGEGYVLDEHLCVVDPQTGFLLYGGDCVTCCTVERHEGKLAFKRDEAARALRGREQEFDDEVRSIQARHGETPGAK